MIYRQTDRQKHTEKIRLIDRYRPRKTIDRQTYLFYRQTNRQTVRQD